MASSDDVGIMIEVLAARYVPDDHHVLSIDQICTAGPECTLHATPSPDLNLE